MQRSKITKPNRLRTCNFCRKSHLKCDSKQPCTNCSIRKVECSYSTRKQRISKRELQLSKELARLKSEYNALKTERKKQLTVIEEVNKFTVMSNLNNILQYQSLFYDLPKEVHMSDYHLHV